MRTPRIKPALRRLWRDDRTMQVGLDPDRSVVVTDLDAPLVRLLERLASGPADPPGSSGPSDASTPPGASAPPGASTSGVPGPGPRRSVRTRAYASRERRRIHVGDGDRAALDRLLGLLRAGGTLDDAAMARRLPGLDLTERQRLAPDLAALSLATETPDRGTGALLARRRTDLTVFGAGRVGSLVAALLAAAGVGGIAVVDPTPVGARDFAPGGLGVPDLGGSRAEGMRRVIAAVAPSTLVRTVAPPEAGEGFAVIAPDDEPDRRLVDDLVRLGTPHLVVRVLENRGIVGPMVVPGRTSCVRCSDLHREARDPAWPRLVAQILTRKLPTQACDVVLAARTAALGAAHVLAYLAGDRPPSFDGTIELAGAVAEPRRRSWPAHPGCGCHWDHLGPDPELTGDPESPEDSARAGRSAPDSEPAPVGQPGPAGESPADCSR